MTDKSLRTVNRLMIAVGAAALASLAVPPRAHAQDMGLTFAQADHDKSAQLMMQIADTRDMLSLYLKLKDVPRKEFLAKSTDTTNAKQVAVAGQGFDALKGYGDAISALVATGTSNVPARKIADVAIMADNIETAVDTMSSAVWLKWLDQRQQPKSAAQDSLESMTIKTIGNMGQAGILSLFGPTIPAVIRAEDVTVAQNMFVSMFLHTQSIAKWNLNIAQDVLQKDGVRYANDAVAAVSMAQSILQKGTNNCSFAKEMAAWDSVLSDMPATRVKAHQDAVGLQNWIDYTQPAKTLPRDYSSIAVRFGKGFGGQSLSL